MRSVLDSTVAATRRISADLRPLMLDDLGLLAALEWLAEETSRRHGFTVEFYDIPLVTDFFRTKVEAFLGTPGLFLLKIVNPDALPLYLRTNFYLEAVKRPAPPAAST